MIRAVAYCRVSTKSEEQKNSFDLQQAYFRDEVIKWEGYELIDVYADRGFSGTMLSRPEFDRMLYDAGLDIIEVRNETKDNRKLYKKYVTVPSSTRKPKFNLILVKDTSRFARNIIVWDILNDLKKVGVHVRFLDHGKSTENDSDATYLQLFNTFDEAESRARSTKVTFGIREGAKRGKINANKRLYGYTYIQKENRLETIPEEEKVIGLIFSLYSKGNGIRRIINQLDERGIKTRLGKSFVKTTIGKILDNEKYAGRNVRMKYTTGTIFKKSYPKRKPENEG